MAAASGSNLPRDTGHCYSHSASLNSRRSLSCGKPELYYISQRTLPLDSVFSPFSTVYILPERWHLPLWLQKHPIYWQFSNLCACLLNCDVSIQMFYRSRMSAIKLYLPLESFYWILPFSKWPHHCLSYRNSSHSWPFPVPYHPHLVSHQVVSVCFEIYTPYSSGFQYASTGPQK